MSSQAAAHEELINQVHFTKQHRHIHTNSNLSHKHSNLDLSQTH